MTFCALSSCARRLYRDQRHGPQKYCSVACRNRAKWERQCRARRTDWQPQHPWTPQPDREALRVERWLAAMDAKKRRLTPKFGWMR